MTRTDPGDLLLEVSGVSKRFVGTQALANVDFDVRTGEVHALLGQNGAGKSTLIKIVAGVYHPDEGEIRMRGRSVRPGAESLPIAFIHQDLGLVSTMTVAENVALLAGYPRRYGLISWRATRDAAARALHALDVEIGVDRLVAELTPPERSLVAIARALAHEADVVFLDEPTASLPERDVRRLFAVLERLRAQGVGLVYVTHRIDEVFRLADRVTVLRDGRYVGGGNVADCEPEDLVRLIVGRQLASVTMRPATSRETVLDVRGLCTAGVGPVSFTLHTGEVLGLVGLRGAGHDIVGRVIAGVLPRTGGHVNLLGTDIHPRTPGQGIGLGIGLVPGDRGQEGVAPTLTVGENVYPNQVIRGGSPLRITSRRGERARTRDVLDRFDIRPRDPDRPIGSLSGGNQQKVVVARWLESARRLLVLEDPTAGVDVGAKADIYQLLDTFTESGGAALVISSDFEEITRVCHRALVLDRGVVVAEVAGTGLTVTALTALTSGAGAAAPDSKSSEISA